MTQQTVRRLMKAGAFVATVSALWMTSGWAQWRVAFGRAASGKRQMPTPSAVNSPVPDMSGFWEIRDMNGAGLRGGALIGHPDPPVLTEEAKAAQQAALKRADSGRVVSVASQYCLTHAYPFFLTSSPPFDIVQGPNEIMFVAEPFTSSRRVFLNQEHPDAAHLEYTVNGDAVGHWEGDTLVVDTIGFRPAFTGTAAARHSKQAHLVERYKLFDNGNRLSISFEWTDPEVYAKPYKYELGFYRSSESTYAMEDWCDASDPLESRIDATPLTATKKNSN